MVIHNLRHVHALKTAFTWRFPEMGVPPVIIHFMFGFSMKYANQLLGYPPWLWTPPHYFHQNYITVYNLHLVGFSIITPLSNPIDGNQLAGLATECAADGEPFTLSGCVPIPCLSSTKAQDTGYVVYLGRLGLKTGPKSHGPRGWRGPHSYGNHDRNRWEQWWFTHEMMVIMVIWKIAVS